MGTKRSFTSLLVGGLFLGLGACGDATGPDGDAQMNVLLTGSGSTAQAFLASVSGSASGAGDVSLEDVDAIEVEITRLEAILAGENEEDEGAWVELPLSASLTNPVDLLGLPAGGIEIASGEIEAGTYSNLRIFFGDATITLANDVTVGEQTFSTADNPHDLFIPSGEQTGIKIPLFSVTIEAEADVVVLFDEDASVNTVAATGTGLLMEPVLGHVAEEAGS